jgi:ribonuclease T2
MGWIAGVSTTVGAARFAPEPMTPAPPTSAACTLFAFIGVVAALTITVSAEAQSRRIGDFDFYVLALSWSPSYCRAAGSRAEPLQCRSTRPFAFVVHGLWPQYESGFPRDCYPAGASRLRRHVITSMLDLMPSRSLIRHQWRKHGTCSGLSPTRYFAALRQAYDKISIPVQFRTAGSERWVDPRLVEREFLRANIGLGERAIAVTCDRRRLREVRICLTRSFNFRDCHEVDRRACARRSVTLPAARIRARD